MKVDKMSKCVYNAYSFESGAHLYSGAFASKSSALWHLRDARDVAKDHGIDSRGWRYSLHIRRKES